MTKTAVVLFNLGGPDRPESVQPFLFNLFNDPAIIGAPGPIRWALAKLISSRRARVAREIYEHLGGSSPLLANTEAQAAALQAALADLGDVRVFIAMRYWHPLTEEAVAKVADFGPDRVVLLPLYPQYSTTTSGSSLDAWHNAAEAARLTAPSVALCCYPREAGFVSAIAGKVHAALDQARAHGTPRLLFSAHGLPKKIVERGDPYQWQVEASAEAVVEALGLADLDWGLCYQSRVGPLEWIGPATEDEIARAGRDKVPIVLLPIAFVSEHSETLVELDIEYRKLAEESGVPAYIRAPTVGTAEAFVAGLAELVRRALTERRILCSEQGGRICPARWSGCPQAADSNGA
ncbi:MAG: ferrochelatase [Rhodospirillales bacterium]|nr:ferrochelatase [Rhodospirillales bacterium]